MAALQGEGHRLCKELGFKFLEAVNCVSSRCLPRCMWKSIRAGGSRGGRALA
jgi:hypothetical protein